MANYGDLDESQLSQMLSEANSYEERSLIRQALRQKKKQRGATVGRPKGSAAGYNRFAGTSRSTGPAPKNYIAVKSKTEQTDHSDSSATKPVLQTSGSTPEVGPRPPSPELQQPPSPELQQPPSPELQQPPSPELRQPPSPELRQPPSPELRQPPSPELRQPPSPEVQQQSPSSESNPLQSEELTCSQREDDVDGSVDPGLGEEGASTEPVVAESPTESTESPVPKQKDRIIEETDGYQGKADTRSKQQHQLKETKSAGGSSSGGPRSLKDYQRLTQSSATSNQGPVEGDDLQKYLVAYVNKELALNPPLPLRGRALFEAASDPANLCKLINKSVPNTVDLRALTKIPVRASAQAKREALEENMVLAVESGRAIGCRVTDSLADNILQGDPSTIHQFLVDLIRARVVHMPGMDEEPSSTFTSIPALFSKLNIPVESVDHAEPTSNSQETTPRTYEERAALRKAERERKRSGDDSSADGRPMTYEERAAQRKLERERRRKEREALAK